MTTNIKYSQLECLILYMWLALSDMTQQPTFNPIRKTKIELKSITQFSKPEAACPDKAPPD